MIEPLTGTGDNFSRDGANAVQDPRFKELRSHPRPPQTRPGLADVRNIRLAFPLRVDKRERFDIPWAGRFSRGGDRRVRQHGDRSPERLRLLREISATDFDRLSGEFVNPALAAVHSG